MVAACVESYRQHIDQVGALDSGGMERTEVDEVAWNRDYVKVFLASVLGALVPAFVLVYTGFAVADLSDAQFSTVVDTDQSLALTSVLVLATFGSVLAVRRYDKAGIGRHWTVGLGIAGWVLALLSVAWMTT